MRFRWPTTRFIPDRFDAASCRWVPEPQPPPPPQAPERLTLVTWNCWFGEHLFAERAAGLLHLLAGCDADVICLQEVTAPLWSQLCAAPWVRGGYRVADASGASLGSYGVALLSRWPILEARCCELPTSMGRSLLLAVLDRNGDGGRLAIGACHLESRRHNADVRAEQAALIQPLLREAAPDALWAGDFNFHDEWQEEQAAIGPDFMDLWPLLRGAAPGYTVDTEQNAMLAAIKDEPRQVRFDRVLLRSPSGALRPRSIELLGTAPLSPGCFASDHFGLRATLSLRGG